MANIIPTYNQFITNYPAFTSMDEGLVMSQITISAALLDSENWGDYYDIGISLDVAHCLSLQSTVISGPNAAFQAAAGPITSVSGAGISTSFASPQWNSKSQSENWYMKTIYGQQFLRLRSVVIPAGVLSV